MLVLTRKFDETVWIGENICIRVVEITDKQVKIEIEAPGAAKGEANMLILTRKEDETILIGENISIKIVEIRGKQVRFGIEAPANLLVLRGEVNPHEQDKPVETEA